MSPCQYNQYQGPSPTYLNWIQPVIFRLCCGHFVAVILCLLCFRGAGEAGRGLPITGAVDAHTQMQRISSQPTRFSLLAARWFSQLLAVHCDTSSDRYSIVLFSYFLLCSFSSEQTLSDQLHSTGWPASSTSDAEPLYQQSSEPLPLRYPPLPPWVASIATLAKSSLSLSSFFDLLASPVVSINSFQTSFCSGVCYS